MLIDGKILMHLQNEGWNRVLAYLLCGTRSKEPGSQEFTVAVIDPSGWAGGTTEQEDSAEVSDAS